MNGFGLSAATRRVADHARSLVQLQLQLAATEVKQKLRTLGLGLGLAAAAGVLAFFAVGLGLATAAAAIATTLAVWLSLLIVFGGVMLVAAILGAVGVALLKKGSKAMPEEAIAEARITTEALRNGHQG